MQKSTCKQCKRFEEALGYLPLVFDIEPEEGELIEISWRDKEDIARTILDAVEAWREEQEPDPDDLPDNPGDVGFWDTVEERNGYK